MKKQHSYIPSAREQDFVVGVRDGRYDRQVISGIKRFAEGRVPEDMQDFYSRNELDALLDLEDSAPWRRGSGLTGE